MTRFESSYKSKVNIVCINVDEKETPEQKRFGKWGDRSDSIPFTVWIDGKGNLLDEHVGTLTDKELGDRCDKAAKKVK